MAGWVSGCRARSWQKMQTPPTPHGQQQKRNPTAINHHQRIEAAGKLGATQYGASRQHGGLALADRAVNGEGRLFESRVNEAVAQGAKLMAGNQRQGAMYSPTLLDHVLAHMTVAKEETFGPVTPVIGFKNIEEAIQISNGTAYGLPSAVCTNRLDYINRFFSELHVGTVNVHKVPGYRRELPPVWRHQRLWPVLQIRGVGCDQEFYESENQVIAMALTLQDIERLFEARGHDQYSGEPVTQLQCALQTAALAESEVASDALVTSALLHDLGHLLHELGETPSLQGIDDVHQHRALPFMRSLFDVEVLSAIKLHVDAKRYLCATRQLYRASLSADSKSSLLLQGGIFSVTEAEKLIAQPGGQDAVRLRLWDDLAKDTERVTPLLSHFMQHVKRCAKPARTLAA